ncbi:hypothetical protein TOPH_05130 [Tolypocladium ophioglossoides CBS 100239]|uniref:Uncharacterized protein n=1 Tax=Tolypocladium ophioglossoides (strain CBS 100239) TaxID=1163406 RepID=A0A0L0N7W8_TOLOC|nr:hypothetical protein TOPH_05130 [Tolypocladium ophioglossoides CBS 100239]
MPDVSQDHKRTADERRSDNMADRVSNHTVTVILATTIPSIVLIILASVLYYRVRRRKSRLFNRGITPIDDEEIESWKFGRADEKAPISQSHSRATQRNNQRNSHPIHRPTNSAASIQKPASVIVYQNPSQYYSRMSEDVPASPPHGKQSVDIPQTPVLARAPNARPGLTDEAVQGDDAFISQVKRHPSRLAKHDPASPRHNRSKSTRATMTGTTGGRDLWYGQQSEYQTAPRRSADTFLPTSPTHRSGSNGVYSSRSTPPRTSYEEDLLLGGLSPRPVIHQSEIGRAIG